MEIVRAALRWGLGWAIVGAAIGVALMFDRAEFIAESGAKPHDLGSYDIWVVFLGIGGALFGAGLGAATQVILRLWTLKSPADLTLRRHCAAAALAGGILGGVTGSLPAAVAGLALGGVTPAAAQGIGQLGTRIRR